MNYSIADIATIIEASKQELNPAVISHLLLDSRRLVNPSTTLFFAIKGQRRDGHQFISELYKKGVLNFVVNEEIITGDYPEANFLKVKDGLLALQKLAKFHREQFDLPIIGITGSNGKTIVKEWLFQLLQHEFSIVRSPKSYNSQIGVPLSVWQIEERHNLGIFEAGISQKGEMSKLADIIQPEIGVLTNIGDAHNEGFINNVEKLNEKLLLFNHARRIIGFSKYLLKADMLPAQKEHLFLCGTGVEDDLRILGIDKQQSYTEITIQLKNPGHDIAEPLLFKIPFTDDASIENSILCLAVCHVLGQDLENIALRMEHLYAVEMRLQLKKGNNNCTIINDSYSNDISSLNIALDYLRQQSGDFPTTVIISDIPQSGIGEEELYTAVAMSLKVRNIKKLVGVGEAFSRQFSLFTHLIPETHFYLNTEDFLREASSHQFREEFILLKGARSFEFERIGRWLEQKLHQTVLEINLNAIAHNLKEYQQYLLPTTKVMAMVKAFAYGSGGAEIAAILQYHKADYLGVAYADEGVELRKAGIRLPVMVMNPEESSFLSIVSNQLEPEIYSFDMLAAFEQFLTQEGIDQYPIHIEIETGMNRLGFNPDDMIKLAGRLTGSRLFRVVSVFSHLAASEDETQDDFTFQQFIKFERAADQLRKSLGYDFLRHIANTAAILRHRDMQLDMVRLGIGMYGVDSAESDLINLETVATLRSTVAQIKKLRAGESVSYNRKGKIEKETRIATVRIGYADGYPRRLGNGAGKMYIKGRFVPVVGTVCMDMTMVDITEVPDVKEGDDIIIFGQALPVQQLASWAGTIPYEIMTGISQRVKRVYFEE